MNASSMSGVWPIEITVAEDMMVSGKFEVRSSKMIFDRRESRVAFELPTSPFELSLCPFLVVNLRGRHAEALHILHDVLDDLQPAAHVDFLVGEVLEPLLERRSEE